MVDTKTQLMDRVKDLELWVKEMGIEMIQLKHIAYTADVLCEYLQEEVGMYNPELTDVVAALNKWKEKR